MIEKIKIENVFKDDVLAGVINELVDRVNWIDKTVEVLTKRLKDCEEQYGVVSDMVNIHEREIDQLQMSINPEKCDYDDERKWIGKLCKFRDGGYAPWQYGILTDITPGVEFPYWMRDIEFAECQPVLEEEFKDVIYKKGQK